MGSQEEKLSADLNSAKRLTRRRLRTRLFMVVPVVGLFIAVYLFMFGGRYITTDNAYIKADVVNVGAEISGNIASVSV